MNLLTFSLRTPLVEFRSALSQMGLRTREDYDELLRAGEDCELRLFLRRLGPGQLVHCFITVPEDRLRPGAIETFNDLCTEGWPAVAYGCSHGKITFEFEWIHASTVDWGVSARKVESLSQRLKAVLGPKPAPTRIKAARRLAPQFLDGVLAQVVSAA